MTDGRTATPSKASAAKATAVRKAVVATAQDMSRRGLSPGRSGNVSARFDGGMLITPTGMAYDELTAADIAYVAADGSSGKDATPDARQAARQVSRKPSSEWRFHLAAYAARPDVGAVVHTHSTHATVLACAHRPIPAFHYMVAIAGGADIPCVPYATFGSAELSAHVVTGLTGRNACLMASHGMIAVALTLPAALELAAGVEVLAEAYWKVLQLGPPRLLDAQEMARVIEKFKGYGQQG
jgi:L-fuculose-phosphate aldolase